MAFRNHGRPDSAVFFKMKLKLNVFLDTLILKLYFFVIRINNFRGDLSVISAKTATVCPEPRPGDSHQTRPLAVRGPNRTFHPELIRPKQ